ncbi:hypothetical protein DPMN_004260 [Dreissena polymorpha]|uniref:Uncharacterized protein n=1 Tax=Dreissena polymorpha TaxID=45954 RepID=A0A9D4MSC3_DREPO|nr:hypothetical protein DPMN_004260 [Dreissena polymorpha]
MCSIDSSLVAVIILESREIHFIRVTTNGRLVQDRKLNLQHDCSGIAHHHGNLYITSGIALYPYSLDGTLLRKLYDDTTGLYKSSSCAVSHDGERIYVANKSIKSIDFQLVTLSRDGIVISKLTEHEICLSERFPPGLHVTDSGQVLVYYEFSKNIFQIDRDGREKLAVVVRSKNKEPLSVFFSKRTGSLIMGARDNNNIKVFKTQRLLENDDKSQFRYTSVKLIV